MSELIEFPPDWVEEYKRKIGMQAVTQAEMSEGETE